MSQYTKMISQQLYDPADQQLVKLRAHARSQIHQFNQSLDRDQRKALLKDFLGNIGEHILIEPPFRCDYGFNIHIGENFFANFGFTVLDSALITIGDNCQFGPNVSLYTPIHPLTPHARNTGIEGAKPITIGDNVWLGGSVTVNPGVTIGNNTVIGSGSVVTKDIPDNVIAVGNPCRVLRQITDEDTHYWDQHVEEAQASSQNETQ
ncbi:hypothetical protein AOC36_01440 [Erysipelothrix larvae]|uniref:Acetyltransferase n=1 Tax=Erysipelothrix larvae TaxID=1514105 RepID=A0A0X8GYD5_9FIRM|nr:sugar O-acetyltransferase [Erysipelothrix larvae]AMC92696.1 hypothetical protein AOC36_01440 [Erysipelothrix larvae]